MQPAALHHAGIATQSVVEKKLAREEGLTRHDLGRDKFLERVFEWKEAYGGKIFNQLRRLGSSLDWSRERFTMDDMLSKAVKEAFVRMHSEGLVYRDNRLVNWCCKLKTAISDIEVDHIDLEGSTELAVPGQDGPVEFGSIWSFAYPYEDGSGEIVVATTRPETMLGDTAVAVHPEDVRYKAVQGKFVVHPFNGRKIPIIVDAELVDMSFGTGAVKITPAHDPNDFMTGKRHNLEFINMLTEDGLVNEEGGDEFKGMKRFTARRAVIAALDKAGLYRGKADNPMRLGLCSRSKDVIEPMLKPQWWVDCKQMAADACEAARDKRLEILPTFMEPTWWGSVR
jgi:valyl-tRNA synthetase